LTIYSYKWEKDLFTSRPAYPAGLTFLKRVMGLGFDDPVVPTRPLQVKFDCSEPDFIDSLDQLLGYAEDPKEPPVGLYLFSSKRTTSEQRSHWMSITTKTLNHVTQGRFFGHCRAFQSKLILVIHGAERERLESLQQELSLKIPNITTEIIITPDLTDNAILRPSGLLLLRRVLEDPKLASADYPESDLSSDDLTELAFRTIRDSWQKLEKLYQGRYVAYYGTKLLGMDDFPHRLYDRFVTQDRPANSLVVVRIDSNLLDYLNGTDLITTENHSGHSAH
jgi:hypothetical protein